MEQTDETSSAAAQTAPVTTVAVEAVAAPPAATGGTWTRLASTPFTSGAGFMQLLTDGTVLVSDISTKTWRKLTPDINGSYLHGTWTTIALAPYAPLYFGSGILTDGRMMVEGGEYNAGSSVWTNLGAVYNPVTNTWASVAPPAGWSSIGDASSAVLANGTYMQSDCCSTRSALLNQSTMTWTATGTGKQGASNDEESWTVMQDGRILTVDCNNTVNLQASEFYSPTSGAWTLGPNTANKTCDINADGSGSHENGPAILRYDGTVYAVGGTGHNDIYHVSTNTWTAAADSPNVGGQLDSADGPAVLLPNGNELIALSPGVFNSPTHMYEWNGSSLVAVATPPGAASDSSFQWNFMLLPTGEVLATDFSNDVELYVPTVATPVSGVAPVITTTPTLVPVHAPEVADAEAAALAPAAALSTDGGAITNAVATLHPGSNYSVGAQRMSGLTEAVAYGDDAHPATNYPILRIKSTATGHVFYGRTFSHSNRSMTSTSTGTFTFNVPTTVPVGAATITLVANGIPSPAVAVNIK
ncbi:MAG TPA: hypothetical protein VGC42_23265 [Kofleriaceae bacterium]